MTLLMRIFSIALVIILGSVGLCAFLLFDKRPELVLPAHHVINIGSGTPGEVVHGSFLLKNRGNAPLVFKIIRSCGCTELSPSSGTLLPNSDINIRVAVKLTEFADSERTVRLTIESDDPESPRSDLVVQANCPSPFTLSKRSVNFGNLVKSELADAERTVKVNFGTWNKNVKLRLVEEVDAFPVTISHSGAGDYLVMIKASDNLASGSYFNRILLETDLNNRSVSVPLPVSLRVVERISAVPSTFYLRQSAANSVVDFLLVNRFANESLKKISLHEPPVGFRLEEVSLHNATRLRVRLHLPEINTLTARTRICIRCDGGKDPEFVWVELVKPS